MVCTCTKTRSQVVEVILHPSSNHLSSKAPFYRRTFKVFDYFVNKRGITPGIVDAVTVTHVESVGGHCSHVRLALAADTAEAADELSSTPQPKENVITDFRKDSLHKKISAMLCSSFKSHSKVKKEKNCEK